jgi:hypothetical protein
MTKKIMNTAMRLSRAYTRFGHGEYSASDPRLQAVSNLHGPEELRQAAHRLRLIRRDTPTTLLIFSPWTLERLGLTPNQIVEQIPHGNSHAAQQGYTDYQQLQASRSLAKRGAVSSHRSARM